MSLSFRAALPLLAVVLLAAAGCTNKPTSTKNPFTQTPMGNPEARAEWENRLLADPATGQIPPGIRKREIRFAQQLPKLESNSRSNDYQWTARGPFNFGGRTRAAAFDVTDENVMLAGSVSGGIYRTTNQGQTWTRVSPPDVNYGISALAQDIRTGHTNVWYCGAGEDYSSASQGSSALYRGNGMMKSTDGGITWTEIASTVSNTPESTDPWDLVWRLATDPAATDDVVYAAIAGSIQRSTDGGDSWTTVVGGSGINNEYSDVAVASDGVVYAAISSADPDAGIHRSVDGSSWVNIGPPDSLATNLGRIVIAINPQNENELFVLAQTPGRGKTGEAFNGSTENNSLWKYTYISGNGTDTGGQWTNLADNIPTGPYRFDDFYAQGGYDLMISVKPDDGNTIVIGGTNLYRSTDGFTTPDNVTYIGGYDETTDLPDFQLYPNHHPDQHLAFFLPSDPNVMVSCNDGGIFKTTDIAASTIEWQSLNNEYNTTQFYTVYLDHGSDGSMELMGGLQDNGTFYTQDGDPTKPWSMPISYDGAFGAIADGGSMYITSIQLGRLVKFELDDNGVRTGFRRFDPIGGSGYDFIHPFVMDPVDNNILYLPAANRLWRNDDLYNIAVNNEWDSISQGWTQLTQTTTGTITAVSASESPAHRVYLGTSNAQVYRVDNAHTGDPALTNITNGMGGAGNVNCIAIDPRDADKLLVVISNYNALSLFYSEDGGNSWGRVSGNLEGEAPDGAPANLYYLGDGPSVRWAEIIPVAGNKTVYLIGTSVGLMATDELILGQDKATDITEWTQVANESIGTNVCTMIDYRQSDNFVAVATHGAGIWTANIHTVWGITGLEEPVARHTVKCYPNPANRLLTIETGLSGKQSATANIYTLTGALVQSEQVMAVNSSKATLSVESLPKGTYIIEVATTNGRSVSKFVKY